MTSQTIPIHWGESVPVDIAVRDTLATAIKGACDATEPFTKARNKALASIKWRLRAPDGQYAGLDGLRAVLTDPEHAQTFDGRDNERVKLRFWSAILSVPLAVELVSFGV